jgi:hypothetical protein
MKLAHTLFSGLAFASVALGFILPNTLSDGHWAGTWNATTGEIEWTKIKDLGSRDTARRHVGGGATRAGIASAGMGRGVTAADAPSVNKRDEVGCTGRSIPFADTEWLWNEAIVRLPYPQKEQPIPAGQ